jgi:hypothetical protein
MKSIKTLKKQSIKAAQLSFKSGELDEGIAKKFIKGFKGLPLNEAVVMLNSYLSAVKREIGKTTLTITSASKLSGAQVKDVEGAFKSYKVLATTEELSPSILGGIKVRIGDVIFDNSVRSKINQVKEALIS